MFKVLSTAKNSNDGNGSVSQNLGSLDVNGAKLPDDVPNQQEKNTTSAHLAGVIIRVQPCLTFLLIGNSIMISGAVSRVSIS